MRLTSFRLSPWPRAAALALAAALLAGCATTTTTTTGTTTGTASTTAPQPLKVLRALQAPLLALTEPAGAVPPTPTYPRQPQDPFEPFNRKVQAFNDGLDRAVLRPVAVAYHETVPRPVRQGVGNFLSNVSDVWSTLNSVLQLKLRQSVELGTRVAVNTVLGLGGVIDVASGLGLEHRHEDFGQTLGVCANSK